MPVIAILIIVEILVMVFTFNNESGTVVPYGESNLKDWAAGPDK